MSHAKVSIVLGMQFGDEGKGMGVNRLFSSKIISSQYEEVIPSPDVTVRFNGSAQAAHNVIANGKHHTFSQFSSGYLSKIHTTYLHKTFLVSPWDLLDEAFKLDVKVAHGHAMSTIRIHEEAPILLPLYGFVNKLEELSRGENRHGSCGRGVGVLAKELAELGPVLRHKDLTSKEDIFVTLTTIRDKYFEYCKLLLDNINFNDKSHEERMLHDFYYYFNGSFARDYSHWLMNEYYHNVQIVDDTWLTNALGLSKHVVFEGAQGILLDEWRGFHPHTTWSSTNLRVVHDIFEEHEYEGEYHTYGMVKAFQTRHGAGPFPTEDPEYYHHFNDEYNGTGVYQGAFRYGKLDIPLLRYALKVAKDPGSRYRGIDSLQIACADQIVDAHNSPSDFVPEMVIHYREGTVPVNLTLTDLNRQSEITKMVSKAKIDTETILSPEDLYKIDDYLWSNPSFSHGYETPCVSYVSYSSADVGDSTFYAEYEA